MVSQAVLLASALHARPPACQLSPGRAGSLAPGSFAWVLAAPSGGDLGSFIMATRPQGTCAHSPGPSESEWGAEEAQGSLPPPHTVAGIGFGRQMAEPLLCQHFPEEGQEMHSRLPAPGVGFGREC